MAYATRRAAPWRRHSNVIIVFLITGLWHGADWKFVLWGLFNGSCVLLHTVSGPQRRWLLERTGLVRLPRLHAALSVTFTFLLFAFGSIFFLARSTSEALYIVTHLFQGWELADLATLKQGLIPRFGPSNFGLAALGLMALFGVEALQEQGSIRERLMRRPGWMRFSLAQGLIAWILLFGVFDYDEFIYFQF
jgi:hypothetical protein